MFEIPQYGLRAYALLYSRHGSRESFSQSDLDWIVTQNMRKKIFHLLSKAGWIRNIARNAYKCVNPEEIFKGLLEFRVPEAIKSAQRPYAFTGLSAIEIWSDYSYILRGVEKSPYFIKILKKDLKYWKKFFSNNYIPYYINQGSTVGEYVILIPVDKIKPVNKEGFNVEPLKQTLNIAKHNEMYKYVYNYMRRKYGNIAS